MSLPTRTIRPSNVMVPGEVDFTGMMCEEASIFSREKFIPCCAPVTAVIWYKRDGKNTCMVCAPCASHAVENRGAKLLASDNNLYKEIEEEMSDLHGYVQFLFKWLKKLGVQFETDKFSFPNGDEWEIKP